jgi:stearoyl-CoA desaturase (delta-9 desaturase)
VVFLGTGLYHRAAHNREIVERYGKGTPDDFLEFFYDRLSITGPVFTLVTNLWLFGMAGLPMWLVEMAWIPFFAAGVINGLGHYWGYRNFETPDASTNLPGAYWSMLTAGEALHNNHHHIQNAARFSMKKGEIDPGYLYFRILQAVGLASQRRETVGV